MFDKLTTPAVLFLLAKKGHLKIPILSNCVLEHIDGLDSALSEISRVLKPEARGELLTTVPTSRWESDGPLGFPGGRLSRSSQAACGGPTSAEDTIGACTMFLAVKAK